MIRALMRRDFALRYLGRWLFVGPLLTLTMTGVIAFARLSAGGEPAARDLALTLLTLWIPSAVYIGVNAAERRCSRFDMELPISSSDLWRAHIAAIFVAGLVILAATAGMMWFVGWAASMWLGLLPAVFPGSILLLALRVIPVLLLGISVAQSVSPSLERLPSGRRLVWSVIGAMGALFVLVLALGVLPLAVSLVPLAVAAVVVRRAYTSLPGTMVAAPVGPVWLGGPEKSDRTPAAAEAGAGWDVAAKSRGAVRRALTLIVTITRSTTKMPVAPIVGVPILLAAGFTMAGAFGEAIRGDDSIRFSLLFIISYTLLSFSGLPPRRLFMLDALPISRRLIFAAIYLPLVLMLSLGYAAGRIVADNAGNSTELINYFERDDHYYVSTPLRDGELALDGNPPQRTSPWGEAHDVWSREIFTGSTGVVHSLFSTPPGSSREFVALQMSRAAKAIYGEDLSPDEVSERYLAVDSRGRVVPKTGELTLAADHPDWRVRPHGPVFPVMMLLVCVPWLLAMSFYLRTLRPGYSEGRRKSAFWWGMIVLMGLHVSQFAALFTNTLDHWVLSGVSMVVVREMSERLPGGSVTVWVLCGLVIYGFYRMAESRFLRVESSPGDDMRIALIERPIGAAGQEGAYAR